MDRLPFGEVVFPVASAGPLAVFLCQMWMQRSVSLRTDCGGERVIVGLCIVTDNLDLFLDEPFAGGWYETWRAAEIIFTVLVELVPAGIDDDDIAWTDDLTAGFFQIIAGDRLPLVFRQRYNDARAEEMRQRTSSMNGVPCTTWAGASI
jgi:hypothetical protein